MLTTEKLLDAAEKRMRKGGYNAVSFRELASDTNIKSSSVHYHYPKKEDLGVALVDRYSEKFFEALTEKAKNATSTKEHLKEFQTIIRSALQEDEKICLCGLLGAESAGLPIEVADGVQTFFKKSIKWLEDVMPAEMSKSEKTASAYTLLAGHQGAMMLAISAKDNKVFDVITDQLIAKIT